MQCGESSVCPLPEIAMNADGQSRAHLNKLVWVTSPKGLLHGKCKGHMWSFGDGRLCRVAAAVAAVVAAQLLPLGGLLNSVHGIGTCSALDLWICTEASLRLLSEQNITVPVWHFLRATVLSCMHRTRRASIFPPPYLATGCTNEALGLLHRVPCV